MSIEFPDGEFAALESVDSTEGVRDSVWDDGNADAAPGNDGQPMPKPPPKGSAETHEA